MKFLRSARFPNSERNLSYVKRTVNRLFFFEGATVNGDKYLDKLENWIMQRLSDDESDDFIVVQDGAPPHCLKVRQSLNTTLPDRWIGRCRQDNRALVHWPPRSRNLTPCDFFLRGLVR